MLKKIFTTLFVLLLIGLGSFAFFIYNEIEPKFPAEVITHDEPPIESVKRFMNTRYDTLEASAKGYVLYTEQLSIAKISNIDQTKNFILGEYYSSENKRPTKEIIDRFINSPAGAFIYKESKETLKKSIQDKDKRIKDIYKSADGYETKIEKDLGLSSYWLRHAYHGTYGAKQAMMNYDDESLHELINSLNTLMNDVNRSVFDQPINLFHRNNAKFKTLSKDELQILNLLIKQALIDYPYGRTIPILEDTGVNLYLGEKLLQSFNSRVGSALKEVGQGPSDGTS